MSHFICFGYAGSALVGTRSALTGHHDSRLLRVPRLCQEQPFKARNEPQNCSFLRLEQARKSSSLVLALVPGCPFSSSLYAGCASCSGYVLECHSSLFLGLFLLVPGGIPDPCSRPWKFVLVCSGLFQGCSRVSFMLLPSRFINWLTIESLMRGTASCLCSSLIYNAARSAFCVPGY